MIVIFYQNLVSLQKVTIPVLAYMTKLYNFLTGPLFQYTTPALMRSLAQAVNILFSHLLGDAISPTIQGEVSLL